MIKATLLVFMEDVVKLCREGRAVFGAMQYVVVLANQLVQLVVHVATNGSAVLFELGDIGEIRHSIFTKFTVAIILDKPFGLFNAVLFFFFHTIVNTFPL